MKANESNLQLPVISVKELQDHIEDDNFFRVYGNPVVIKCDGYPDCVVMSIEHMERLRKTIDEAEKAINAMAVMMCPEDYKKYWEEFEKEEKQHE